MNKNKKKTRLTVERLEDRTLPSVMGVPWQNPNHLTLSFVHDGTNVDGYQSALVKTLGAQGTTTKAWELAVLQAFQTWAVNSNINIGVVADGGQALGAPGLPDGLIRVAAEPYGLTGPLALTTAPNPIAGTRAGDMVFNSSQLFSIGATAYDIFTTALHEAGHDFNIPDQSTDPTSVMYNVYSGVLTGLSPSDIAALQAIYGTPTPDSYQGTTGNGTFSTASAMALPDIAGRITTPGQAEFFRFQVPSYADRNVKFTVQTAGLSLFTPRLSIYDANHQLISSVAAPDPLNGGVTISLSNVKRGTVLYLEVQGGRSDVFGMGSYRLKVDSGDVSRRQINAIDVALNGPTVQYVNFNHTSAAISTANAMNQPVYQIDPHFNYAVKARLNDASDVNFFSIVTPASAVQALIFTASPGLRSQLDPNLTVYDANGNPVAVQILSNDPISGYVVQILNPAANAKYYVAISANAFASSDNMTGTYMLGVEFTNNPIVLQTIVNSTMTATNYVNVISIRSAQAQMYHFVLSVNTGGAASSMAVAMQLFDPSLHLVSTLVCHDGQTISEDVQLLVGTYTVRFIGNNMSGAAIPTTWYSLLGLSLSQPLDPVPVNPTTTTTTSPTTTTTTTPTTTTTATSALTITDASTTVLPAVDPTTIIWTPL